MTGHWYEDDAFWRAMQSAMFTAARWESAPEEVTGVIALTGVAPGTHVLDLPCGPGRHSLELRKRGYVVTGVDRYEPYLDEARERAEMQKLDVEWVRADMRDFHRPGSFDLAINLYSSFGYFDDEADELRTLANLHNCLKPGGALVMEMVSKERVARDHREREWLELDDGGLLLEQRTVIDHWRRMRTRWIIIREGDRFEREMSLRLFSAGELIQMLEDVGFVECDAFGWWDGSAYDENAKRLIVTARK